MNFDATSYQSEEVQKNTSVGGSTLNTTCEEIDLGIIPSLDSYDERGFSAQKNSDESDWFDIERARKRQSCRTLSSAVIIHSPTISKGKVYVFRYGLMIFVAIMNAALAITLALSGAPGYVNLLIIVLFKSRDTLSCVWLMLLSPLRLFRRYQGQHVDAEKPTIQRKVATIIPVYKESITSICESVDSLLSNQNTPSFKQEIMVLVLDGFGIETDKLVESVLDRFDSVPYTTWKGESSNLSFTLGMRKGQPIVIILKARNAGKKDTLILGFDILNPSLDQDQVFNLEAVEAFQILLQRHNIPLAFDYIFTSDADSLITEHALEALSNRLDSEGENTIAACGVIEVNYMVHETGRWQDFGLWHIFDKFQAVQYLYGQNISRRAESSWGRVTCMPGPSSMFRTGQVLSDAIVLYREPVLSTSIASVLKHQVQYLGTDRRLCWSILSQGKQYRTVCEYDAHVFTEAPQNIQHFISQRRRWGTNAFANALCYSFGPNQFLITRMWTFLESARTFFVFFRLYNTAMFFRSLAHRFDVIKLVPLLTVTALPPVFFLLFILVRNPRYRKRLPHYIFGWLVMRVMGYFVSAAVFISVLINFGSFNWGQTGAVAATSKQKEVESEKIS